MNVWLVLGVVLFDVILMATLVGTLSRVCWGTFLMAFPPKPILQDHLRRNYQSYSIGIFNLGWCIHTVIDDEHLHLIPIRLLQWFGCSKVSVPWDQVHEHPSPGKSKSMVRVKIANQVVYGPRWALDCRTEFRVSSNGQAEEDAVA
jgi:hypothetical protein